MEAAEPKRVRKLKKPPKSPERTSTRTRTEREARHVREFHVGEGLPNLTALRSELQDMTDVLLGRKPPPIDAGVLTLQEVADAYFARASELTMLIQRGESEGTVAKGSAHYKMRTGELRTFMEMAKRAADLGSRRLTREQLVVQMRRDHALLGWDDS